jgi:hypothetical protein
MGGDLGCVPDYQQKKHPFSFYKKNPKQKEGRNIFML